MWFLPLFTPFFFWSAGNDHCCWLVSLLGRQSRVTADEGKVRGSTQLLLPVLCCRLCSLCAPREELLSLSLAGYCRAHGNTRPATLRTPSYKRSSPKGDKQKPILSEMRSQMLLARVICPSTSSLLTARTQAGSPFHWVPSSPRNQVLFSAQCAELSLAQKRKGEKKEGAGRRRREKRKEICDSTLGKSQRSATTAES